ncbi:MAG: outer membrane beta-barrel protein [Bacteroidales bacterium]|nr:outer membrane beta-barrel protein [Bacteroidales bacterium]
MKKAVFLFCAMLLAGLGMQAQSYMRSYDHHDLQIGYAMFTPDQFFDVNTSMLDELYPEKRYVRDNYSGTGGVFITYRHIGKNENWLWGVTAGASANTSEIYNVGQYAGELKRTFITAAIEGEYRYRNQGPVQLYSGLGLGFTYGTETLTTPEQIATTGNISGVAYQLNVIGLRLGTKFAGFAEFGFGYKGIVNIGFSMQWF